MKRLFALLLCLVAPVLRLEAQNSDPAIDADLKRLGAAMQASDFPTMVDMMYAPIVEAGGGKQAVLDQCHKLQADLAAQSMKIVTFECRPPYTIIPGATHDYAIIPDHTVLQIGEHHVELNSFQLGIRNHGTTQWQYVTGTEITPALRDRFFPDLPKTVTFPTPERKQLD